MAATPDSYTIDVLTSRMNFGGNLLPSKNLLDAKKIPFIGIFFAVFVALYYLRPRFIMSYAPVTIIENGKQSTQLSISVSYLKFLFYWIIFSVVLCIGYYAYVSR